MNRNRFNEIANFLAINSFVNDIQYSGDHQYLKLITCDGADIFVPYLSESESVKQNDWLSFDGNAKSFSIERFKFDFECFSPRFTLWVRTIKKENVLKSEDCVPIFEIQYAGRAFNFIKYY